MVDFTAFHDWMQDSTALRTHLLQRLKMYLDNHRHTRAEVVVPAVLLTAYQLHSRNCKAQGVTDRRAIDRSWTQQCQIIPAVVADAQKQERPHG